jgi:ABC-type multidrug transport system fused ATPase/permease subunit
MIFWGFWQTVFSFVATLALNRLLAHLESPETSVVTPYVWVVMLLAVPIMMSMFMQQYFVHSIQLTANAKAALLQALYEKTLRVRISGGTEDAGEEGEPGERNRVGRINNLMSSDVYLPVEVDHLT